MPYNLRVLQLGVTGKGTVTSDNTAMIAKALGNPAKGDGGCAMGGGDSVGWIGMLLMGPLVALLRRQRSRRR
jgi:hypothetical protein